MGGGGNSLYKKDGKVHHSVGQQTNWKVIQ